MQENYF